METNEFISLVRNEVGTAVTRQRILELTNRAQNEILSENNEQMRVMPDPFFATADATYSYVASSYIYDSSDGTQGSLVGDIRDVSSIYSFSSSANIFDQQTLDPSSEKPNQVELTPTKDRVTARVDVIKSTKPDNSDCVVKWWEGNNPGDTTITWRAKAYKWPDQLVSENIDLTLTHEFHDTLLFYAVLRRLERREYRRNEEAFSKFEFWYKRWRNRVNRTATQDLKICFPGDF